MSMEVRMLLAIVLSLGVFLGYDAFFVKKEPVGLTRPVSVMDKSAVPATSARSQSVSSGGGNGAAAAQSGAIRSSRTIKVLTNRYGAEFSEAHGSLKGLSLSKFRETASSDSPAKEILDLPENRFAPEVLVSGGGGQLFKDAVFTCSEQSGLIDATKQERHLTFTLASSGLVVEKIYTFQPDAYVVNLQVKVTNQGAQQADLNLTVSLPRALASENEKASSDVFVGPSALINGELKKFDLGKVSREDIHNGLIPWIAWQDQYFAAAIFPQDPAATSVKLEKSSEQVMEFSYSAAPRSVSPQASATWQYRLYCGPKQLDELEKVDSGFAGILDFGFLNVIARPLLHAIKFLYRLVPNYGVVIMLITLAVKMIFWPLSAKSYESMSQMKRLQPKMAEIREKYNHDKKLLNQELMNLYKVYKVNPLGGCLPMIMQIPVFLTFYKVLYQAVELRHAPFMLWITDLSAPDRLFSWSFKIPFMTAPYGIPVLTIVMGASMFLQQKMSPPPGDPAQAKIMMILPIFFTFIFINFPSGLVLYWLVNNVFSMVQQYFVTKKMA